MYLNVAKVVLTFSVCLLLDDVTGHRKKEITEQEAGTVSVRTKDINKMKNQTKNQKNITLTQQKEINELKNNQGRINCGSSLKTLIDKEMILIVKEYVAKEMTLLKKQPTNKMDLILKQKLNCEKTGGRLNKEIISIKEEQIKLANILLELKGENKRNMEIVITSLKEQLSQEITSLKEKQAEDIRSLKEQLDEEKRFRVNIKQEIMSLKKGINGLLQNQDNGCSNQIAKQKQRQNNDVANLRQSISLLENQQKELNETLNKELRLRNETCIILSNINLVKENQDKIEVGMRNGFVTFQEQLDECKETITTLGEELDKCSKTLYAEIALLKQHASQNISVKMSSIKQQIGDRVTFSNNIGLPLTQRQQVLFKDTSQIAVLSRDLENIKLVVANGLNSLQTEQAFLKEKFQNIETHFNKSAAQIFFSVSGVRYSKEHVGVMKNMQVFANVGGAYHKLEEKFICPKSGYYFFSINGATLDSESEPGTYLQLIHNGREIITPYGQGTGKQIFSNAVIIKLEVDDTIEVGVKFVTLSMRATFTGFLIKAD